MKVKWSVLRKLFPNTALTVSECVFELFSATLSCTYLSGFQPHRLSYQANVTTDKQTKTQLKQ